MGIQIRLKHCLIDRFRHNLSICAVSCKAAHSADHLLIQRLNVSQHTHFHIIFRRGLQTGLHIIAQQFHQRADFTFRPVPILCGKRIHGQIFNPHSPGFFADPLYILTALCMPVISRHSLGFCPSPVSVQDDGNMLRYVHCISSFLQVFPSRRWKREASSHLPLLLFRNIGLSHRLYPKLSVLLWILLPPLYRLLQCICLSVSEVNLPSL